MSLLETYEHELTGKYDLYTKLVFDYTDFVMRCEDEESAEEYETFVQENRDKKKMVERALQEIHETKQVLMKMSSLVVRQQA